MRPRRARAPALLPTDRVCVCVWRAYVCGSDEDHFVHFVNMLMNDVTFLLDEVFEKLAEIAELETLREAAGTGPDADPRQLQDLDRRLAERVKTVRTLNLLGQETLRIISRMTSLDGARECFLRPEMVSRLASSLNYIVDHVVGARASKMKVREPEQYYYRPARILAILAQTYLNVENSRDFCRAVVADTRSFDAARFRAGVALLEQLPEAVSLAERWGRFVERIWTEFGTAVAADDEDEDVPDEFLDPVTCALMDDPVLLPTSNHVMDRAAIARHLLSDPRDPFNREPLSIEQLQPLPDLKRRIDEYRARAGKRVES